MQARPLHACLRAPASVMVLPGGGGGGGGAACMRARAVVVHRAAHAIACACKHMRAHALPRLAGAPDPSTSALCTLGGEAAGPAAAARAGAHAHAVHMCARTAFIRVQHVYWQRWRTPADTCVTLLAPAHPGLVASSLVHEPDQVPSPTVWHRCSCPRSTCANSSAAAAVASAGYTLLHLVHCHI